MDANGIDYKWIISEEELMRVSHKSPNIPWHEDLYNRQRICGLMVDLGMILKLLVNL